MQIASDLQDYANSFKSGYLKMWKATSIICTLRDIPKIIDDEVRFLDYLKNCLEMEGFNQTSIELIMGWLFERKEAISGGEPTSITLSQVASCRYLTNITIFDGIEKAVAEAARLANLRVEYEDSPMPLDDNDFEMFDDETGEPLYHPAALEGVMGSIVTYERAKDHSEFWEHFRRIAEEVKG